MAGEFERLAKIGAVLRNDLALTQVGVHGLKYSCVITEYSINTRCVIGCLHDPANV